MATSSTTNPSIGIFISYRQADDEGRCCAQTLYNLLNEQPLADGDAVYGMLKVYWDGAAPAIDDFRKTWRGDLAVARALVLVCTPSVAKRREGQDWLYDELEWWLKHRKTGPILIDVDTANTTNVPARVLKRWPHAQRLPWPGDDPNRLALRIMKGIRLSQSGIDYEEIKRLRWRNRLLLAALLVVMSLSMVIAYFWQRKAEEQARTAMARDRALNALRIVTQSLVFDIESRKTEYTESGRQLIKDLITQWSHVSLIDVDSIAGLKLRAEGHGSVADLYKSLNERRSAQEEYKLALADFQALARLEPMEEGHRYAIAVGCFNLGQLIANTLVDTEAESYYTDALTEITQLVERNPNNASFVLAKAKMHVSKGQRYRKHNRNADAEADIRQGINLLRTLVTLDAHNTSYQFELAQSLGVLGSHLTEQDRGRAITAFHEEIALLQPLAAAAGAPIELRNSYAKTSTNLGNALRDNHDFLLARQAFDSAISTLISLAAERPAISEFRHDLGITHGCLASLLEEQDQVGNALGEYTEALKILTQLTTEHPKSAEYAESLCVIQMNLGSLMKKQEKLDDALPLYKGSIATLQLLSSKYPEAGAYSRNLAIALLNTSNLYDMRKEYGHARDSLEEAERVIRSVLAVTPGDVEICHHLERTREEHCKTELRLGNRAKAMDYATKLAKESKNQKESNFAAARLIGICLIQCRDDKKLEDEKRTGEMRLYRDQVVKLLGESARLGFDDIDRFRQEADGVFNGISEQAEFKEIGERIRVNGGTKNKD